MKYKLIDYYDVWSNEEDGYEVNNLSTCVTGIEIADDTTDADIINYLKSINFLSEKATTETVEVDGEHALRTSRHATGTECIAEAVVLNLVAQAAA